MSTVFILVDALKSKYLSEENMPFLLSLSKNELYVKKVVPSFSFCERTEIFTGMHPKKSGNFTAIGYDPQYSEYAKYKNMMQILSKIDKVFIKGSRFSRTLRRIMDKYFASLNIKMKVYNIPFNMVYKFRLTEDDKSHYINGAFKNESIFDVLSKENKKMYTNSFTALGTKGFSSDGERVNAAINVASDDYDVVFVYLGDIDWLGHLHNNNLEVMRPALRKADNDIRKIYEKYTEVSPDTNFIVLGDHGMMSVDDSIDIISQCNLLPFNIGSDYDYFLDSTIARFWIHNSRSREGIEKMLSSDEFISKGFILDEKKACELNIPNKQRSESGNLMYGDIIWCANKGVVIAPDFFNTNKELKGMHGFADVDDEGKGLLVITNQKKHLEIEECNLVDICPTLSMVMGVPVPNGNEGINLLAKESI